MPKATIETAEWFGVHAPYDADMVTAFKKLDVRSYDADTRTWWFPVEERDEVDEILADAGLDVEEV